MAKQIERQAPKGKPQQNKRPAEAPKKRQEDKPQNGSGKKSEGLNRACLLGNLGADPELRYTKSDMPVLNLSLATNTRYKTSEGEWAERTDWHRVTLWGKRAEALNNIITKGAKLYVEGEIRTSKYEKDGETRYSTDIHASNIFLCGGGKGSKGRRPDNEDGDVEEEAEDSEDD